MLCLRRCPQKCGLPTLHVMFERKTKGLLSLISKPWWERFVERHSAADTRKQSQEERKWRLWGGGAVKARPDRGWRSSLHAGLRSSSPPPSHLPDPTQLGPVVCFPTL